MKKIRNKLTLLLALFVLAISICGCGEKKTDTDGTTKESATGEVSYPVEIVDSFGNTVIIEKEPVRVVSCAPNLTEMMYDIGAEDKLVGRSDYCDYPEQVLELPSVGAIAEPDLETIIALEPDLVVATAIQEGAREKLNDVGIAVVVLKEEATVEGDYKLLADMGSMMNRQDKANECMEEIKTTIADVEKKVAGKEKPTVYYVMGFGEYGDYTAGGDTFVGQLIECAGGDNIAKNISGWSITLEEIIESDPEIIIIAEYMYNDFINAANYKELTAVKEGRVYIVDPSIVERQGCRNASAVVQLATIFYPEEFK